LDNTTRPRIFSPFFFWDVDPSNWRSLSSCFSVLPFIPVAEGQMIQFYLGFPACRHIERQLATPSSFLPSSFPSPVQCRAHFPSFFLSLFQAAASLTWFAGHRCGLRGRPLMSSPPLFFSSVCRYRERCRPPLSFSGGAGVFPPNRREGETSIPLSPFILFVLRERGGREVFFLFLPPLSSAPFALCPVFFSTITRAKNSSLSSLSPFLTQGNETSLIGN